jgi:hypothetical protein
MNHTNTFTESEFFNKHAPDMNFEMDSEQLIEAGISKGFIESVGDDQYIYAKEVTNE